MLTASRQLSSPTYNAYFWLNTFGLLLVWYAVYVSSAVASHQAVPPSELNANTKSLLASMPTTMATATSMPTPTPIPPLAPPSITSAVTNSGDNAFGKQDKKPSTVMAWHHAHSDQNTIADRHAKTQGKLMAKHQDPEEKVNLENCKSLCHHCGCMGFYCGEECICECNDENSDTECLATMQNDARNLGIPFELLIQGPSSNRFVHNAFQYAAEPTWQAFQYIDDRLIDGKQRNNVASFRGDHNHIGMRKKRSTVRIYRPPIQNSFDQYGHKLARPHAPQREIGQHEYSTRHKRSIKQLDWLNDFTNSLVRPAPLTGLRRGNDPETKQDEELAMSMPQKRNTNSMDRSWFMADNTKRLLRPAPLFGRRAFGRQRNNDDDDFDRQDHDDGAGYDNNNENDNTDMDGMMNDDSLLTDIPRRAVEQLPKALQDTLRSIQDTTMGNGDGIGSGGKIVSAMASSFGDSKLGETLRSRFEDGANMLSDGNLDFLPSAETMRENLQQTLQSWRSQILPGDEQQPFRPLMSAIGDTISLRNLPSQLSSFVPTGGPFSRSMHAPATTTSTTTTTTETPVFNRPFPLLRPIRFLQHVRQAID